MEDGDEVNSFRTGGGVLMVRGAYGRNEGEETAASGYGLGLQSDKASLSSSGWMKPRRKLYSIYIRFLSQPAYMYSMLLAGPCCVNP